MMWRGSNVVLSTYGEKTGTSASSVFGVVRLEMIAVALNALGRVDVGVESSDPNSEGTPGVVPPQRKRVANAPDEIGGDNSQAWTDGPEGCPPLCKEILVKVDYSAVPLRCP